MGVESDGTGKGLLQMHSSKRLAATSLWEARSLEEAGLFEHLAQCPLRLAVHDHDAQRARE